MTYFDVETTGAQNKQRRVLVLVYNRFSRGILVGSGVAYDCWVNLLHIWMCGYALSIVSEALLYYLIVGVFQLRQCVYVRNWLLQKLSETE